MDHQEKLNGFLLELGLHPDQIDVDTCTRDFVDKMQAGLAGLPSPFLMLPTYLSAGENIPEGGQAIAIDAGGTNLRVGLVRFETKGPLILWQSKAPMPGTQGPVTKEEFFLALVAQLSPALDQAQHIGFCFSFPAQIQPDLDARVIGFNKNVKISGAEGMLLCRELERYLPGPYNLAVINDTAAAYLGGVTLPGNHDGAMGFILGTGTNTCYPERVSNLTGVSGFCSQQMLINIEAAGFDGFTRSDLEIALDKASTTPGEHLYEKAVSGVYLGDLIGRLLNAASERGLLSSGFAALPPFDMAVVDAFLQGAEDSLLSRVCAGDDDARAAEYLCNMCIERASRLVTVNLSGVMVQGDFGKQGPVRIITEGSTFWRCKTYHERIQANLEAYAGRILGRQWQFVQAVDANLVGAAAAGLSRVL